MQTQTDINLADICLTLIEVPGHMRTKAVSKKPINRHDTTLTEANNHENNFQQSMTWH